ncbi:hypothetical protein ACVW2L_003754 [Mucilaginibacter sp. HD30]
MAVAQQPLDTKVTKKSSQADRCHYTGQTPGRAHWQAFALLFIKFLTSLRPDPLNDTFDNILQLIQVN